jgi:hypothetical protein
MNFLIKNTIRVIKHIITRIFNSIRLLYLKNLWILKNNHNKTRREVIELTIAKEKFKFNR